VCHSPYYQDMPGETRQICFLLREKISEAL
jgi:hypothetical protein